MLTVGWLQPDRLLPVLVGRRSLGPQVAAALRFSHCHRRCYGPGLCNRRVELYVSWSAQGCRTRTYAARSDRFSYTVFGGRIIIGFGAAFPLTLGSTRTSRGPCRARAFAHILDDQTSSSSRTRARLPRWSPSSQRSTGSAPCSPRGSRTVRRSSTRTGE